MGVNPPEEQYKAPLPKKILHDFFGCQTEEEKANFDLYQESLKNQQGGGEGGQQSAQGQQPEVMRIGEPIPGYTGMNRRMVADNVFGLTYANARRASQQSQNVVESERI